jgi:hypothetical protein
MNSNEVEPDAIEMEDIKSEIESKVKGTEEAKETEVEISNKKSSESESDSDSEDLDSKILEMESQIDEDELTDEES